MPAGDQILGLGGRLAAAFRKVSGDFEDMNADKLRVRIQDGENLTTKFDEEQVVRSADLITLDYSL